jgi:Transposase DDE domain
MHDTVPTQALDHRPSPVAHHLVAFLQALLQPAPDAQHAVQPPRRRGQPARLAIEHLWLALLLAVLRGITCWNDVWRLIAWEGVGSFPIVSVTSTAVRQRLRAAGTASLEQLLERVNTALRQRGPATSTLSLAPFATQVVALDETTLDALHRWCPDLRGLPAGCAQLLVGKLAGLFDLRAQQWIRVQFRADVLANCKVGVLMLLDCVAPGSLILADLGYFSFPWFDYLTDLGYWWVSRLRERTSYRIVHVFYQHGETLDALIWLGVYRADRAAHLVRLVQFRQGAHLCRYLTNVTDPAMLSMLDIARLYARRWDIELAFKLLKRELGVHLWWAATPVLVLQQLLAALILAQLLHALQLEIAAQAQVDPFEVSLPILVKLLAHPPATTQPLVPLLVERGRLLGLIRPSTRLQVQAPSIPLALLHPPPADLPTMRRARYARRKCAKRTCPPPPLPRISTQFLI